MKLTVEINYEIQAATDANPDGKALEVMDTNGYRLVYVDSIPGAVTFIRTMLEESGFYDSEIDIDGRIQ